MPAPKSQKTIKNLRKLLADERAEHERAKDIVKDNVAEILFLETKLRDTTEACRILNIRWDRARREIQEDQKRLLTEARAQIHDANKQVQDERADHENSITVLGNQLTEAREKISILSAELVKAPDTPAPPCSRDSSSVAPKPRFGGGGAPRGWRTTRARARAFTPESVLNTDDDIKRTATNTVSPDDMVRVPTIAVLNTDDDNVRTPTYAPAPAPEPESESDSDSDSELERNDGTTDASVMQMMMPPNFSKTYTWQKWDPESYEGDNEVEETRVPTQCKGKFYDCRGTCWGMS